MAWEQRYDSYTDPVLAFRLSERPRDAFCYVAVYDDYVHLGFNRGAELLDVDAVLKGTVKGSRYMELRSIHDLRSNRARLYIREALANIVARRPPLAPHAVPARGRGLPGS